MCQSSVYLVRYHELLMSMDTSNFPVFAKGNNFFVIWAMKSFGNGSTSEKIALLI